MYVYLGMSEYVTVRIEITALTKVVVTTTTAEDVTMNVSVVHFNTGSSCLVNSR